MSTFEPGEICVVGYALNPKKLRKSSKKSPVLTASGPPEAQVDVGAHQDGAPPTFSQQQSSEVCVWQGGGLADILLSSPEHADGVQFIPWDHEQRPASQQPPFHVLIHKLTEDIEDQTDSSGKIRALEEYLLTHPKTVLVDPIDCVRKVTSRARTCEFLEVSCRGFGPRCPFSQPNYLVVEDVRATDSEVLQGLAEKRVQFPVICKPLQACGTPNSHSMVVIMRREDIGLMVKPCVVQQYYDHNHTLFKVYVIEDEVMVYRRQSLPDLVAHTQHQLTVRENLPLYTSERDGIRTNVLDEVKEQRRQEEDHQRTWGQQHREHGVSDIKQKPAHSAPSLTRETDECPIERKSENSRVLASHVSISNSSNGNSGSVSKRCIDACTSAEVINNQKRQRRLKSLPFDSRHPYPTLADFIDLDCSAVDPSYEQPPYLKDDDDIDAERHRLHAIEEAGEIEGDWPPKDRHQQHRRDIVSEESAAEVGTEESKSAAGHSVRIHSCSETHPPTAAAVTTDGPCTGTGTTALLRVLTTGVAAGGIGVGTGACGATAAPSIIKSAGSRGECVFLTEGLISSPRQSMPALPSKSECSSASSVYSSSYSNGDMLAKSSSSCSSSSGGQCADRAANVSSTGNDYEHASAGVGRAEEEEMYRQRFLDTARALRKGFGLSLFGFDAIIPNYDDSDSDNDLNKLLGIAQKDSSREGNAHRVECWGGGTLSSEGEIDRAKEGSREICEYLGASRSLRGDRQVVGRRDCVDAAAAAEEEAAASDSDDCCSSPKADAAAYFDSSSSNSHGRGFFHRKTSAVYTERGAGRSEKTAADGCWGEAGQRRSFGEYKPTGGLGDEGINRRRFIGCGCNCDCEHQGVSRSAARVSSMRESSALLPQKAPQCLTQLPSMPRHSRDSVALHDEESRQQQQRQECRLQEQQQCQEEHRRGKTRDILVIDVNYFPSYKEVADFPQRLRKFLRVKAGLKD